MNASDYCGYSAYLFLTGQTLLVLVFGDPRVGPIRCGLSVSLSDNQQSYGRVNQTAPFKTECDDVVPAALNAN